MNETMLQVSMKEVEGAFDHFFGLACCQQLRVRRDSGDDVVLLPIEMYQRLQNEVHHV